MRVRPSSFAVFLKRCFPVPRVTVGAENCTFLVDPISHFGRALLDEGRYEPEITETLKRRLFPGATFVDVGANEGFFSILAGGLVGSGGRVIAIEPQQRLQSVIAKNAEMNELTNLEVHQVAISDSEDILDLHLAPDVNTGGSALARATRYPVATQRVTTMTLTRFFEIAGIERVDLMKMDIEGFEYEAILGSKDIFKSGRVGGLALELHPPALSRRNHSADEIVRFLESSGYERDATTPNTVFLWNKARQ